MASIVSPLIGKRQIRQAIIDSLRDYMPNPPDSGTLQAILDRLDVALSTRASEQTLQDVLGRLDVALSTRASEDTLQAILGRLDVPLSTRASEQTASSIASSVSVPSGGGTAQLTVGTSPVAAAAESTPAKTVVVKSDSGNGSKVCIGFSSGVTPGTGFCLDPGESISIDIDDVSKLYLVSEAGDNKVYLLWVSG